MLSYILKLYDLVEGRTLTEEEITEVTKRKSRQIHQDLFQLVCTGKLKRIPGIASSPAQYCLPDYAAQLLKGKTHNVL